MLAYRFPDAPANPTGVWEAEICATDLIGNPSQIMAQERLQLDAAAPTGELGGGASGTAMVLTAGGASVTSMILSGVDSPVLTGVITDTVAGVDRLDVSFAPLEQVAPMSGALLWLPFDEPAGRPYWDDRSGQGNDARCLPETQTCPSAGHDGREGGGLYFEKVEDYQPEAVVVGDAGDFSFEPGASFSIQAWVRSEDWVYGDLVRKPNAYALSLGEDSHAAWQLQNSAGYWSLWGQGPEIKSGEWYHIVGTFDSPSGAETGTMRLFVNGQLTGESTVPNALPFRSDEPLLLGGHLNSFAAWTLDEVVVLNHTLSAAEVEALYEANRPRNGPAEPPKWYPATLAQRGAGVKQTSWTLPVPSGLEGLYQVDLRGRDVLGNTATIGNAWRGTIDNVPPRLTLKADPTGTSYINLNTNVGYAAVRHVCAAEDMFLDAARFNCPGANLASATRSFVDDPVLRTIFPDYTLRDGLAATWTEWRTSGPLHRTMEACDLAGNCASQSVDVNIEARDAAAPVAVVTSPTEGAFIASDGKFTARIVARSNGAIWTIGVRIDGRGVYTGTATKPASFFEFSVPLTVSEGQHEIEAWTPNQPEFFPVTFTMDTQKPTVVITTEKIGPEDVYNPGSSILRFQGTAHDSLLCLASVELRVNDGPFQECTLEGDRWSTAYFVNAPEGQTLTAAARATDCAGQVSEVTRMIPTDLTPADAPDTEITSTPRNPSAPDVTFAFRAIKRARDIAALMCRLDDALFTPCASPMTYSGLSAGPHTFSVRAVDVEGWVDGSPANYTWTVRLRTFLPLIFRGR